jgi:hypothetical protein
MPARPAVRIVREATEREGGKSGGIGEESVFLLWYRRTLQAEFL